MYYDFRIKQAKNMVLVMIIGLILAIAVHSLIEAGLSCVDKNGCIRSHCDIDWLNSEYEKIVLEN